MKNSSTYAMPIKPSNNYSTVAVQETHKKAVTLLKDMGIAAVATVISAFAAW